MSFHHEAKLYLGMVNQSNERKETQACYKCMDKVFSVGGVL